MKFHAHRLFNFLLNFIRFLKEKLISFRPQQFESELIRLQLRFSLSLEFKLTWSQFE